MKSKIKNGLAAGVLALASANMIGCSSQPKYASNAEDSMTQIYHNGVVFNQYKKDVCQAAYDKHENTLQNSVDNLENKLTYGDNGASNKPLIQTKYELLKFQNNEKQVIEKCLTDAQVQLKSKEGAVLFLSDFYSQNKEELLERNISPRNFILPVAFERKGVPQEYKIKASGSYAKELTNQEVNYALEEAVGYMGEIERSNGALYDKWVDRVVGAVYGAIIAYNLGETSSSSAGEKMPSNQLTIGSGNSGGVGGSLIQ